MKFRRCKIVPSPISMTRRCSLDGELGFLLAETNTFV